MKSILLFSSLLFCVSAFATTPDSGLNCKMAYSQSGISSTGQMVSSSWLVAGGELSGRAVTVDSDLSKAAHKLTVSYSYKNWDVTIVDSKGNLLGKMTFPTKGSMQSKFNVEAQAPGPEDPPKYQILDVTCDFVYFAG